MDYQEERRCWGGKAPAPRRPTASAEKPCLRSRVLGGRGRFPGQGKGHAGPLCTLHIEGVGGAKNRCGQLDMEVQGRLQLRAELLTKDV